LKILSQQTKYYKSRNAFFIDVKYLDDNNIKRRAQIKKGSIIEKNISTYLNRQSVNKKNTKSTRQEAFSFKRQIKAEEKLEKMRVKHPKKAVVDKYKLKKEEYDIKLMAREHKLTLDGYQASGRRIIMSLMNKNPSIKTMSINDFRQTLFDYMRDNSGYEHIGGIKKTFLNDVIYKWATEFREVRK